MAVCDTCGNDDDTIFNVIRGDETGTFDSFECAIHAMAPRCGRCECRILGHGVEADTTLYCCQHCLRQATGSIFTAPRDAHLEPVADKQVHRWKDDGGAISS